MNHVDAALEIVKKLKDNGFIAYYAGGWVRDFLMGRPSQDVDVATNASVEEICEIFEHTVLVGAAFGVVIVVNQKITTEVATFRKDLDYHDGRRPSAIEKATPQEDAQRRDFTINGMFYDPIEKKVIDYVNGQDDIQKKIIRTIGNPIQRFTEDRLRLLRAIRFSCALNFQIEEETYEAIKLLSTSLFPSVAVERVWQELLKMASSPNFIDALKLLLKSGLLSTIFPHSKTISNEQLLNKIQELSFIDPPLVLLLCLIYVLQFDKKLALILVDTFKLSRNDKELVSTYFSALNLSDKSNKYEWVQFMALPHADVIGKMLKSLGNNSFSNYFLMKKDFFNHIQRIIEKKPLVNAKNLMAQGINPGVRMGELLHLAEKIAILHDCSYPEEVLKLMRIQKLL